MEKRWPAWQQGEPEGIQGPRIFFDATDPSDEAEAQRKFLKALSIWGDADARYEIDGVRCLGYEMPRNSETFEYIQGVLSRAGFELKKLTVANNIASW